MRIPMAKTPTKYHRKNKEKCNISILIPFWGPYKGRNIFVKIPLVNPLLKSVSCVPPPRVGTI